MEPSPMTITARPTSDRVAPATTVSTRAEGRPTSRLLRGMVALLVSLAPTACGGVVVPDPDETGATGSGAASGTSGTGASGATTPTPPPNCDSLCDDGALIACPHYAPAACREDCATLGRIPASCVDAHDRYLSCLIATGPSAFVCAEDGSASIRISACPDEQSALIDCVLAGT